LLATLATKNCWTIRDIRKTIGAGDGCTTCHHVLKRYLTVHQRMEREERTEPSPSHPHRHVPD
jgi:bacterioferritin-associated ferredoxin